MRTFDYKKKVYFNCYCCGKKSYFTIFRDDSPDDYDMRRLCAVCKEDDDPQPYKVHKGVKLLQSEVPVNGKCRTLRGKEFREAAKECTPILEIKNRSRRPSFLNIYLSYSQG